MKLALLLWLASFMPAHMADRTCLATMVYLEARSESQLGQVAVAEVALRRREAGRWGDRVCDVVGAPGQFAISTTSKEYRLRNPTAWDKAWQIAGQTMEVWDKPADKREFVVPRADHFVAEQYASPNWIKGAPVAIIGAHSFYQIN